MENREVARVLEEIGEVRQIRGDNAFRVRAYQLAAETLRGLGEPLEQIARRIDLEDLPHVGPGMAARIREMLATGSCREHQELLSSPEGGLLEIVRLPGIGPKRARLLYAGLGIRSLEELRSAAAEGKLAALPGLGVKTQDRILRSIDRLAESTRRTRIDRADRQALRLLDVLRGVPGVENASIAGSLRRRCETSGDLDLLVASSRPAEAVEAFVGHPDVKDVLSRGDTKVRVRLLDGMECDLRVVEGSEFGAALHYFTGSKAHNIKLRGRAVRAGLKVNEYGVFRATEDEEIGERIGGRTEEEVFASVGLPWIPPELREDRGEIEAALAGELPPLVTRQDIRGDCHAHTTDSDGRASLEEMVRGARELGYDYLAITDHSPHLPLVNGLDEARLARQWKSIEALNARLSDFRILRGVEVDVHPDGRLDLSDACLADADLVIAAVHSQLGMPRQEMTDRVLRAIGNRHVHALAHPTGRKLLARDAGNMDLERILATAAELGVLLECNASPSRLDLDDVHLRRAAATGARVLISTDAHDVASLQWMRYGVDTARRAWLSAENIANARPLDGLLELLASR